MVGILIAHAQSKTFLKIIDDFVLTTKHIIIIYKLKCIFLCRLGNKNESYTNLK